MKITKMVEQFNASVFEVGKLYYLFLANDCGDEVREIIGKGIYLCTDVRNRSADFTSIIPFLESSLICVYIDQDNFETVKQAEEVTPNIEYDNEYKEWYVSMAIEEE